MGADVFSAALTAILVFSRPFSLTATVEAAKTHIFPALFNCKGYLHIRHVVVKGLHATATERPTASKMREMLAEKKPKKKVLKKKTKPEKTSRQKKRKLLL